MKTMNHLLVIALSFVIGSCSKEMPIENEELAATDYKSRIDQKSGAVQEAFELDIHQFYLLGQLARLENEKSKLEEAIENGDVEKIPMLESVLEQIRENNKNLGNVIASTCSFLRIRKRILQMQVLSGDRSKRDELKEVSEKVKKCDLEDWLSGNFIEDTIILAIVGEGRVGGCKDPGGDWGCKHLLNRGELLVNVIESQEGVRQIQLKSGQGQVISTGKFVGDHQSLEGVQQLAVPIDKISQGYLEITKGSNRYQAGVEIR